jgi:uncharacterized membrane protein
MYTGHAKLSMEEKYILTQIVHAILNKYILTAMLVKLRTKAALLVAVLLFISFNFSLGLSTCQASDR